MIDLVPQLSATGLGQIESPAGIAKLPKIDFNGIPEFVAPNIEVAGFGGANKAAGLPEFKINPEAFDKLDPAPFANRDVRKLVNSSVWDTLGYNKNANEEDRYDQAQPWWEATKNATAKLGLTTWNSFTSFFKQNLDTFESLRQFNLEDSWKNDANLTKLAEQQDIDNTYPNFQSAQGQHWYSFIPGFKGSGDFYEQFVPQLGFTIGTMAGAIAENALIGYLTGGIGSALEAGKTSRQIFAALASFSNAAKGVEIANKLTAGKALIRGLEIGVNGWSFYNTAASEAAMEGGTTYNSTKQHMLDEYMRTKGYSAYGSDLKKIEDLSTRAGNSDFITNLPILLTSNAIQFKNILFPAIAKAEAEIARFGKYALGVEGIGAESKIVAKDLADKTFKEVWKGGSFLDRTKLLLSYLNNEKLAFLSEGVEESLQRAASSGSERHAMDTMFNPDGADGFKSISYGLKDMFTEGGFQEFIGGALGGLIFQGAGSIAKRFAMPKASVNENGEVSYKYNFLNNIGIFNEKFEDIKNKEYVDSIAERLNKDGLNDVFKTDGFKDLFNHNSNSAQIDKYLKNNDMFNVKNIKSDSLNRFLWSGFESGKIDLRIQQLQDLAKLNPEEFNALFNIESNNNNKEKIQTVVNHIVERAGQFEKIYERESKRFSNLEEQSIKQVRDTNASRSSYEDRIKKKYDLESLDGLHADLKEQAIILGLKHAMATNEIEREKIQKEADLFTEVNKDKFKELDMLHSLDRDEKEAIINYIALKEGKKATVFAFSDMMDSAERAKEITSDLKKNNYGIDMSDIDNLLDRNSLRELKSRLITQHKSLILAGTAEENQERRTLEERIATLEHLGDTYKEKEEQKSKLARLEAEVDKILSKETQLTKLGKEDRRKVEFLKNRISNLKDNIKNSSNSNHTVRNTSDLIQKYLMLSPFSKKNSSFLNEDYSGEKEAEHFSKIRELTSLQKRHQDNLNLYNRLSTSELFDEFTKHESKVVVDFLKRALKYHEDAARNEATKSESAQQTEAPDEQPTAPVEEKKEPVKPQPVQTETTDGSNPQAEDIVKALKEKLSQGKDLDASDLSKLQIAAILSKEASDFYSSYLDSIKDALKAGDYVTYKDQEHRIEEIKNDPSGRPAAILSNQPGVLVPVSELKPVATQEDEDGTGGVENEYIPDTEETLKTEDAFTQRETSAHHLGTSKEGIKNQGSRTIANELLNEKGYEDEEQPILKGGYVQFRQGFLDFVAQNDLLNNYIASLEVDKAENYPINSDEYKYLTKEGVQPGLVLVIRDKSRNERFSSTYAANPKGTKLAFPLVNSTDKNNLLALFKTKGITSQPVTLDYLSKGVIDVFPLSDPKRWRDTAEYVKDIPRREWSFFIMVGSIHGQKMVEHDGTSLRNGGFFIKIMGSYAKVLPKKHSDIEINGVKNPDIKGLLDQTYTFDEANNIKDFLKTIYYTVPRKSKYGQEGLNFTLFKNADGSWKVIGRIVGGNAVLNDDQVHIKAYMDNQRLNVAKNSFGTELTFYHMVNGKVESVKVPYDEFILKNTQTNKKAYTLNGEKVIKPINRFVTFKESLNEVADRINGVTPKNEPAQSIVPTAVPATKQVDVDIKSLKDLISFETEKGTVYSVQPDGTVKRNNEDGTQDLVLFVRPYAESNQSALATMGMKNEAEFTQNILSYVHSTDPKKRSFVLNSDTADEINNNSQTDEAKNIRLVLFNEEAKKADLAMVVSTTPKVGWYTYTQKTLEGGKLEASVREKVTRITPKTKQVLQSSVAQSVDPTVAIAELRNNKSTTIRYVNANNEVTERTVTDVEFKSNNQFGAYDSVRKERRTFNISGIIAILDRKRDERTVEQKLKDGEKFVKDSEFRVKMIDNKIAKNNTNAKDLTKMLGTTMSDQRRKVQADINKLETENKELLKEKSELTEKIKIANKFITNNSNIQPTTQVVDEVPFVPDNVPGIQGVDNLLNLPTQPAQNTAEPKGASMDINQTIAHLKEMEQKYGYVFVVMRGDRMEMLAGNNEGLAVSNLASMRILNADNTGLVLKMVAPGASFGNALVLAFRAKDLGLTTESSGEDLIKALEAKNFKTVTPVTLNLGVYETTKGFILNDSFRTETSIEPTSIKAEAPITIEQTAEQKATQGKSEAERNKPKESSKIQDIEKRRQEELAAENYRIVVSSELYQDNEGNFYKIQKLKNGKTKVVFADENGVTQSQMGEYDPSLSLDTIFNGDENVYGSRKGDSRLKLTKVKDLEFTNKIVDRINTKYDAELAELPKQSLGFENLGNIGNQGLTIIETEFNKNGVSVVNTQGASAEQIEKIKQDYKAVQAKNPGSILEEDGSLIRLRKGDSTLTKPDEEVKATPKRARRSKKDDNDDSLNIDKLLRKKEEHQQAALSNPELQWLKALVGEDNVKRLVDIVDANAWATWTTAGVTLYKDAPSGTGYHEGWHHFSQLYLTRDEKIDLYNNIRATFPSMKNASDLDVEEHTAELFREYAQADGKIEIPEVRRNIFQKIWDFIKRLFGQKDLNLNKLFADLYKGNLTQYKPSINNAMFGKLNSTIRDKNGNEIFNNRKSTRYTHYLQSVLGTLMADNKITFNHLSIKENDYGKNIVNQLSKRILKAIDNLHDELADIEDINNEKGIVTPYSETIEDLATLSDNFDSVFKQFITSTLSIKPDTGENNNDDVESSVDEEAPSTNDDLSAPEAMDKEEEDEADNMARWRDDTNQALVDSTSPEIKLLIKTLSKVETHPETGLPVIEDGKVKLARNAFGLTEPVNFMQTLNNLGILLEGSQSLDEMFTRMNNQDSQKKIPELALLLERIPSAKNKLGFPDMLSLIKFRVDFAKVFIPISTLLTKIGQNNEIDIYFKEEVKRTKDTVIKSWASNFMGQTEDSENVKKGYVLLDKTSRRPYINPAIGQPLMSYTFSNDTEIDFFLNLLGIEFSIGAKTSSEYKKIVTVGNLTRLRDTLVEALGTTRHVANPVSEMMKFDYFKTKENKSIQSESKILGSFLELEATFSTISPSMSYRNSEGNLQHGLSLHMWLTMNTASLNKSTEYADIMGDETKAHLNMFNNPGIKNSIFLNSMFNLYEFDKETGRRVPVRRNFGHKNMVEGTGVHVELDNYNGQKTVDKRDNTTGKSTTNLSPRQKVIMDINALLTSGKVEIMRTESSASAFSIKLSDYGNGGYLPFLTEDLKGDVDNKMVLATFRGYFEDELNTIINKFGSPLTNYHPSWSDIMEHYEGKKDANGNIKKKLLVNPGRFSLFRKILSENKQLEILKSIYEFRGDNPQADSIAKQAHTDKLLDKYSADVDSSVSKFLVDERDSFKKYLSDQDIKLTDIANRLHSEKREGAKKNFSFDELITSFVVNDLILNIEFSKLYSGSTAYYKAYHKRSKGDISTGKIPITDEFLNQYLKSIHNVTMAYSYGVSPQENLIKTRTAVLADDMRSSAYIAGGVDSMYGKALKLMNPGFTNKQILKTLSPYGKMTVADGQGQASLDFYRYVRLSVGSWDFTDEIAYQKEVIWNRRDKDLYGKTMPAERRAIDNEFMEKYKEIHSYFPPVKMQHNGPIAGKWGKGSFTPVLDKFSIAPLIPSSIKNTPWEKMHEEMIKKGVGYTKFISGTKKYAFPAIDWKSKDWNVELDDNNTYEVFTQNLKEQIETKSKVKEESTWGTQMRKLFLANLFSMGRANFPKFQRIFDDYVKVLSGVVEVEKRKLFKDFGITEEGDNVRIKSVKGFVESLQGQVDLRDLNQNIKDSIGYDESTGSFTYPLEINLNKSAVQDLISGMIFKALTKLKINGDMLIQIASSGYESYSKEKIGTDSDLKFYEPVYDKKGNFSHTSAMQVKVALTKDFKNLLNTEHPDGRKIETLERLNGLLRNEKWMNENRKKVTLIGYRIPTQGPNSMEFMEVAEFLPEHNGSSIILPPEIVAKSGSDYDIDKMNMFRPSLTASGDLIGEDNIGALIKKGKELEKKYQALRKAGTYSTGNPTLDRMLDRYFDMGELGEDIGNIDEALDIIDNQIETIPDQIRSMIEEYKEVKDAKKKKFTNHVMDLYKEVLSSPEMFTQLVTPNSNELVRDVAMDMAGYYNMEIGDYTDTDVYKYLSNLNKFQQLLSGKKDLGAFALANTFSQILQQAGMQINDRYTIYKMDRYNREQAFERRITLHLLDPRIKEGESLSERDKVLSSVIDDNGNIRDMIDLSNMYNVEGVYKQEYFSQLINSTVDIAADPYYMALMSNVETLGPIIYLINKGVPFRRVILFMGQPIIRRYVDMVMRDPDNKSNHRKTILGATTNYNEEIERIDTGIALDPKDKIKRIPASEQPEEFFFDDETLVKQITSSNITAFQESKDNIPYQKRVFAHFLKVKEQADALRSLGDTMKFDTKKYSSPTAIRAELNLRQEVDRMNLFDKEAIKRVYTHSMISPFENLNLNTKIFNLFMPVATAEKIVAHNAEVLSKSYTSKNEKLKLERVLNNDWIEFIIKNFGDINGRNFEDYAKRLMIESNESSTLATDLLRMKSLYPELEQFELFRRLLGNLSIKNAQLKNIELFRGIENSSAFQNIMIEEFEILKNFTGSEVTGKQYSPQEIQDIRQFFTDLQFLAFQQSGYNKGLLSMVDVVPYKELSDIFRRALEKYTKFVKDNPGAENYLIDRYSDLFKINNPKLLSKREREKMLRDEVISKDDEPWRGKLYSMDITDRGKFNLGDENNDVPSGPMNPVVPLTENFSRKSVEADKDYIYLFTDNAGRTSGTQPINPEGRYAKKYGEKGKYPASSQAVIRGLDNAFPITTMIDDRRTQWSDDLFDHYKDIIDGEIEDIKDALEKGEFKGIKFAASMPFGEGKYSKMKTAAPKIWAYLNYKLQEIGIDNRGEKPTEYKVAPLQPKATKIDFQEEQSSGYAERTRKNASADATIAIAVDFNTAGEKLTKSSVEGQKKKYIPLDANLGLTVTPERVTKIVDMLNEVNAKTLNIAGNGIYTMKGKYTQEQLDEFTYQLLKAVIESPDLKNQIESIRTGGQTGFDEAGAKAGIRLGIPTLVLAPKGWKFRNIDGVDISNREQFISRFGAQTSQGKLNFDNEEKPASDSAVDDFLNNCG